MNYTRKPDVFFSIVDGELIILADDQGKFFTSNDVAGHVWEQLENPSDFDSLVASVMDNFDGVDEATAKTDLKEFLGELHKRDLLAN